MGYPCAACGKNNAFVNQCGCDPGNRPTRPAVETTRLASGLVVLAKTDRRYGLTAKLFVNRAQATAAAEKARELGVACEVVQPRLGPVHYVRVL